MSKKYLEDNKKPSLLSRMAPGVISIGSIAAATVITAPGIADSLAFNESIDNNSQVDATTPLATDLPEVPAEAEGITQAASQNPGTERATGSASSDSVTQAQILIQPVTTVEPAPVPETEPAPVPETEPAPVQTPVEQAVADPAIVPVEPAPAPVASEPVPVEQPAGNNSSSTWVGGGTSSSSVIDQQDPASAPSGNSSSPTYYYDDDEDDHDDDHDDDDHDDDHDDDDHDDDDHDDEDED